MKEFLDAYLRYAEQEYQQGKRQLGPWTTSDPYLLALAAEHFPGVPIIPANHLERPSLQPVELLPLSAAPSGMKVPTQTFFIAVGGPPAASVALQAALNGDQVLLVNNSKLSSQGKSSLPIWSGAGNHGEPDFMTEAPAYVAGYYSLPFIFNEFLRFLRVGKKPNEYLEIDFPWLSLNLKEWLLNPLQWAEGIRVAWGSHRLSQRYLKGQSTALIEELIKRSHQSGAYLENLNQKDCPLLRKPRGSLLLAYTEKQWETLEKNAEILAKEGRTLRALPSKEVEEKYGFVPRAALGMMEKTHDFIFEPDFMERIVQKLECLGGTVTQNWQLTRVFIDLEKQQGGILEFSDAEKQLHYRRFHQAHLSLGATPYSPKVYDQISVSGISINALVFGAELKGGPIVCGSSNHLVPLLDPKTILYRDQPLKVSLVRLSSGASVNPLNRGKYWYDYDLSHALHLIHRVRATLPDELGLNILSVRACNRAIGKDGCQRDLHPEIAFKGKKISCERVTIQVGAGGGGLTQMGAIPFEMQKYKM